MSNSKLNIIKNIIHSVLFRPMPLNDFKSYDEYWTKRGFNEPSRHRAGIISEHIDENSIILDIGCGDGTVLDYLAKNCSPKELIGVDISEKAVKHTQERGYSAYQMDVLSGDFQKFLENRSFDYEVIPQLYEVLNKTRDVWHSGKSMTNSGQSLSRISLPRNLMSGDHEPTIGRCSMGFCMS
ncbi:Methyltransferase domain protein [anaerobic digester metagenome]